MPRKWPIPARGCGRAVAAWVHGSKTPRLRLARHVADAGGTALGIDIGGSGIKGALVDIRRGELTGERFRVDTPQPSNVKSVIAAAGEVVRHFGTDRSASASPSQA